jgi:protein NrfD
MREEIITSGRLNPNIDPHLEIWHWHIPTYLFLGGLAAGILFLPVYIPYWGKKTNIRERFAVRQLLSLFC